jgi:exosome complex RNA-binding protein Rrp42 (RNase PH superfamily)
MFLPSDGRGIAEQRQLFLRTGVISQAKGSAYVEQGSTKVSGVRCSLFRIINQSHINACKIDE